jgi:hypothetical protein
VVRAFSKIQYFSQTAAYKFVVQFPRFWGLKAPGGFMEDRALESSSTATSSAARPHEGRNVWVLTAYGIAGLAFFGVLMYFFSSYVTQ